MTSPIAGWRLAGAVCVALVAFAANSVLCRMALAEGDIGPSAFTAIRLASGAVALGLIAAVAGRGGQAITAASGLSAAMLFGYAAAFSFAYVALDAGLGALILFGAVQATMFLGALIGGERPGAARWLGGAAAFGGLIWLLSPGMAAPPLVPALLMAAAGACWGVYSLRGRKAGPPLAATAAAFALAAPAGLALRAFAGPSEPVGAAGAALAIASGALASGGGYAVWYAALPRMEASLAAVAQLTVPVIALAGGMVFLGEAPTLRFAVAALVILGGVGAATLLSRR